MIGSRRRAIRTTLRVAFIGAVLTSAASLAPPASAQPASEQLGTVRFDTSCTPEAQKLFDKGMLYQHSFWYRASQRTFEEVLKKDPECGIAYWGIALSLLWNPHVPPPAKNLADGAAVLTKGRNVGAKTQREKDYLDALWVMYADYDKVDHRKRIVAYANAMEQLARRYQDDDEAQIHYALALNTSASPADKTYANQLKGGALLEPISPAPAKPSWRGSLPDPPLRLSADRREGPRRGAALCQDRPCCGACPAHAVAHLHSTRPVGRFDRIERRVGTCRQGGRRSRRSAPRHGLPGLRQPAIGAGPQARLAVLPPSDRCRPGNPWRGADRRLLRPLWRHVPNSTFGAIKSSHGRSRVKICDGMCWACAAAGAILA